MWGDFTCINSKEGILWLNFSLIGISMNTQYLFYSAFPMFLIWIGYFVSDMNRSILSLGLEIWASCYMEFFIGVVILFWLFLLHVLRFHEPSCFLIWPFQYHIKLSVSSAYLEYFQSEHMDFIVSLYNTILTPW